VFTSGRVVSKFILGAVVSLKSTFRCLKSLMKEREMRDLHDFSKFTFISHRGKSGNVAYEKREN
jgi:hypothetical protein